MTNYFLSIQQGKALEKAQSNRLAFLNSFNYNNNILCQFPCNWKWQTTISTYFTSWWGCRMVENGERKFIPPANYSIQY